MLIALGMLSSRRPRDHRRTLTGLVQTYGIIALLALFLSVLYLRWGLLTTMEAVFALETWLLGYAVYQIFRSLDSILYAPS